MRPFPRNRKTITLAQYRAVNVRVPVHELAGRRYIVDEHSLSQAACREEGKKSFNKHHLIPLIHL